MYIKTTFELYQNTVFEWFQIVFIENSLAWEQQYDFIPGLSDLIKLCLTLFRIVAITGIGYWLYKSLKSNRNHPFAISMIFVEFSKYY